MHGIDAAESGADEDGVAQVASAEIGLAGHCLIEVSVDQGSAGEVTVLEYEAVEARSGLERGVSKYRTRCEGGLPGRTGLVLPVVGSF
ncbi:MAG: hypothetical protein ACC652_05490 [Acidimicrobiales bacterium]